MGVLEDRKLLYWFIEFNMTEKTATEASNDFWLEFKNEKQVIQDQLENSRSLPKSQLPTHFNSILQKINTLEKNVTKATEYIPSYDERQCSLQLKELMEKLETTKAELTPKAKFSFKSRKNKTVVAPVTPSVPLALPKEESEILSDATVLLRDKDNCVLTLKDSERKQQSQTSVDILLSNLHHCVVILEQDNVQISAIHIKNVHHCVIYCGSIEGSVLMYGLTDSVLVVGCHQFRMHDAHHVDIMLHVTSRPIIEDSNNIQVGRFQCSDAVNYYDQLEDFNWLKKQASPNWTLMDQDRYSVINKQLSVLKNDKTEDLLLKGLSLLPTE
ncbi:tubulin binding cofactor C-domain-containing protein [Mucor mucedo]|uniref:tubulin binding cofactor C-domain-containing protein n=1 Tax=Mucor mucedo TaxID=29922 RepID=UPI00222076A4|nr:tubulin binding cofactor C-domain-containing protein [Mucor mucedo]KAI7895508.1 tubulin binding cofactor C-domain-containing protein [Mucor mucedo]